MIKEAALLFLVLVVCTVAHPVEHSRPNLLLAHLAPYPLEATYHKTLRTRSVHAPSNAQENEVPAGLDSSANDDLETAESAHCHGCGGGWGGGGGWIGGGWGGGGWGHHHHGHHHHGWHHG